MSTLWRPLSRIRLILGGRARREPGVWAPDRTTVGARSIAVKLQDLPRLTVRSISVGRHCARSDAGFARESRRFEDGQSVAVIMLDDPAVRSTVTITLVETTGRFTNAAFALDAHGVPHLGYQACGAFTLLDVNALLTTRSANGHTAILLTLADRDALPVQHRVRRVPGVSDGCADECGQHR